MNRRHRIVAETLLPRGAHPDLPVGVDEARIPELFQELRATATLPMRLSFFAALWVATWVAPLLIRRLPPLGRLPEEDRARALLAMGASPIYLMRQLLMLLKMNLCFAWGADPAVRTFVGYPVQHDDVRTGGEGGR